jgi:HSP20 family protein
MSDKDNPLIEEMEKFQNEVSRMISNFYVDGNPLSVFSRREWLPPTDIFETDDTVCLKMEVAGMQPGSIHVTLDEDRLTVCGCREDTPKSERVRFRQMEIKYTRFSRQFLIPASANPNDVEASYEEGFLTVRIGKKEHSKGKTDPIKIEVK